MVDTLPQSDIDNAGVTLILDPILIMKSWETKPSLPSAHISLTCVFAVSY